MPTDPTHNLMLTGVHHHQAGRLPQAAEIYRRVLSLQPRNADALHLLGLLTHQQGNHQAGLDLINRALAIRQAPEFYLNAAEVLGALDRPTDAIDSLLKALRLNPNLPEAHNNLASLYSSAGRLKDAESEFITALRLRPNYDQAMTNLGNLLDKQGDSIQATELHRRAIQLNPNNAAALSNLGNLLQKAGQLDEAERLLRKAVAVRPDLSQAHNNLAGTLLDRGSLQEAIAEYEHTLALRPDDHAAHSNYLFAINRDSDRTPHSIFESHREFGRRHARFTPIAHPNNRATSRRLKIAYVSPDLGAHPVASFLEPILAHHDRAQFHIKCYSDVARPDDVTARLKTYCDAWHDTRFLSDEQLAKQITDDRIDILIDLAGHTQSNRLLVFARKPAPVQITYLGYPNTTGLSQIDYRITDDIADPPGATESFHTEQLLRVNPTFLCYQPPAEAPSTTHLPASSAITFGSFNNFAKVTSAMISLWSDILRAVPNSRMLIKARSLSDAPTRDRTVQLFAQNGIPAQRLDLIGWQPTSTSHLEHYLQIHIALDTYPYTGTTTTCEALFMGVPVVTLAGATHISRVSTSILNNLGLSECIATSPQQYISIAAAFATEIDRIEQLRLTLRDRLLASSLCDAARFARTFESALRRAWTQWCTPRL
jgi:protein O-GlcNAc transferase